MCSIKFLLFDFLSGHDVPFLDMRLFIPQTGGCKTERKQYKEKRLLFMVLSKDDFISLFVVCVKKNAQYNSYEPNFSNWMTGQIKSVRVK